MYGRQSGGVGFGPPVTPPIIKQLLIANVVVFVAQTLVPTLTYPLSIVPARFWHEGFLWQPFTYMWLHSPGSLWHIGFNLLALWMFGSPLALVWGERRFLRFYLICGVGAGLIIATWPALFVLLGVGIPSSYVLPTLGASGVAQGVPEIDKPVRARHEFESVFTGVSGAGCEAWDSCHRYLADPEPSNAGRLLV